MATSLMNNKIIFKLSYLVAFLTLLSLFLLSKATEGIEKFEQFYQLSLITIAFGISFLSIIVIVFLWKMVKKYRHSEPGASLSVTILIRTLLLSFLPLLLLSFFAFKFLRYEFQSSFDKGINNALTNALELSKNALDIRALQALEDSKNVASVIAPYEYHVLQKNLEMLRKKVGADELTVFDEKGFIQAFSSKDFSTIIPLIPEHSDFIRVESENGLFVIESDNEKIKIRTLTNVNKPGAPNYYLQSLFSIPDTISELTEQVNKTITERDKFNYLMPKVSNSFIFVLVLVLLLAGLLLILSSIGFANYMVQPIKDLIRGTRQVSKGKFDNKVLVKRSDDFGQLINAFNQMTQSLKTATEEAELNRNKVESERAYLETVINNMNSGVITLDSQQQLLTFNKKAELLLDCSLEEAVFLPKKSLNLSLENYKNFINQLDIYDTKTSEIEVEITCQDELKRLMVRMTQLFDESSQGGYVIIFEEFGEYWEKQKQAAWEEVARRLAHEIKNPLTPILLAAERLNYKLSGHLDEPEQKVLSRSIDVISNQVKSLKNMVNDFSDYAKPTNSKQTPLSIHDLLKDIFALYKGHFDNVQFDLSLMAEEDNVNGNANLLRQVLHNLIKNSIEACEQKNPGKIHIMTKNYRHSVCISIIDNGIGLPKNDEQIFDPYVTTKEKGTGLGLAIVKKIVQEHNGSMTLKENPSEQGTVATINLPVLMQEKQSSEIKYNEPSTI